MARPCSCPRARSRSRLQAELEMRGRTTPYFASIALHPTARASGTQVRAQFFGTGAAVRPDVDPRPAIGRSFSAAAAARALQTLSTAAGTLDGVGAGDWWVSTERMSSGSPALVCATWLPGSAHAPFTACGCDRPDMG